MVIDTNVLVSGILKQHGAEASVLNLIVDTTLTWCVSQAVLDEYRDVLTRPKFDFTPELVEHWLDFAAQGVMVTPRESVTVSPDDDDNRLLECAAAAGAAFLVTGNKAHYPTEWQKTKIVNARQLLQLLKDKLAWSFKQS